ncbi:MAG: lytic transglycosylase domain-containing protein [Bacteroidota bacterium]
MRQTIYGFALGAGLMLLLFVFSSNLAADDNKATLKSTSTDRILPQIVKAPALEAAYDFAGEPLDMQNFDVRERLERELLRNTYFHSNTLLLMKRSARYFPVIERILAEEGLPEDLKYIAVAESDLLPTAVSPAGAKGFWQFMGAVGKSYGLTINAEVDERFHLEKSTRAACKHLANYRKQFGSWQLAALAYNFGEGNLRKFLRDQGGERFEDLNVNDETMRYVFRLVAIKNIMEQPQEFGFYPASGDYYRPLDDYRTVEVKQSIANLANFAKEEGISYRMLKVYNPWLISTRLTASRAGYEIKVPK